MVDHKLVLRNTEERFVRAFLYDSIGRTGEFELYFDDLKFSDPMFLVHGFGFFNYKDVIVKYDVKKDHTILTSRDQKTLVSLAVAAIDFFSR